LPDEKTLSCPVCGAANRADAKSCTACGMSLLRAATERGVDDLLKDLLEPVPEPARTPETLDLDAEIVDGLLDSILVEDKAAEIRIECPLCGGEVTADAGRCPHCGAEFEDVRLPPEPADSESSAPSREPVRAAILPEPPAKPPKKGTRGRTPAEEIPVASATSETPHNAAVLLSGRAIDVIVLATVGSLAAAFVGFRMYSWSAFSSDPSPLLAFLGIAAGGMAAGGVLFRVSTSALTQGDRLVKQGRYQEALGHFDRAIRMGHRPSNAWTSRGVALKRLGRLDEALRCEQMATRIDPVNEIAWCNLGDVYFRLEDYAKALESYDRAIKIRPKYAIAWNNKGAALARLSRFEEARECHDLAVQLQPKYVAAWLNRGEVLARLGDREGAQKCLERARALGA